MPAGHHDEVGRRLEHLGGDLGGERMMRAAPGMVATSSSG